MDEYGKKTVTVNRVVRDSMEDTVMKLAAAHKSGFERMSADVERYARSAKKIGDGLDDVLRSFTNATKSGLEFAAVVAVGTKAIIAQATATSVLEAGLNRVRAARVGIAAFTEGLGGAAVVAGEIGAVIALEKLARLTLDRADEVRRDALQSARTGLGVSDIAGLQFAGGRSGVDIDTLNKLTKSSGGVSELAARLKEVGRD